MAARTDGSYRITFTPSHTMIDEFRVYPYALAPEEARNAHARFFPECEDAPGRAAVRSRAVRLRLLRAESHGPGLVPAGGRGVLFAQNPKYVGRGQ